MKRGEVRDEQLAHIIGEEVQYLLSAARDQQLSELTVTGVIPGRKGANFTVFVAPLPGSQAFGSIEEIKAVLKRGSGYLRFDIAEHLNLKRAPELTLAIDPFCLIGTGVK